MNLTYVIVSIDKFAGGPSRSVTHLVYELAKNNPEFQIQLHTAHSESPIITEFKKENVSLLFYKIQFLGRLYGFPKVLFDSHTDLYHGQAIWDLPVHQMAKIARKQKVPYVISPRGMLEPWSLQQSKVKKQLALKLYQLKDLKRAACLHATSSMEAKNLRSLGLKNPIAVIPNGIPMAEFPSKYFEDPGPVKKILFLSRIHPKKGIELLIEAWSLLPANITNGWHIDIVGNGEATYITRLKRLIDQKGFNNSVFIKGPVYGSGKVKAYHEASLFVLPTYSENFGIVVAEALACSTPVITTRGAPWQDLESSKCGWWIQIGVEPLKEALEQAMTLPSETLKAMGINGRGLIENKYAMEAVAQKMYQLYEWLLKKKNKPSFVEQLKI